MGERLAYHHFRTSRQEVLDEEQQASATMLTSWEPLFQKQDRPFWFLSLQAVGTRHH
jgi:hypothetical protein